MSENAAVVRLRKQLNYARGLRRVNVLSKLALAIHTSDIVQADIHAQEALSRIQSLMKHVRPENRRYELYRRSLARALCSRGACLLMKRELSQAKAAISEAIELFKELEDWSGLLNALEILDAIHEGTGDYEAYLAQIDHAIAISEHIGRSSFLARLHAWKAAKLQEVGRVEEAAAEMRISRTKLDSLTVRRERLPLMTTIARFYQDAGEYRLAAEWYEQSAVLSRQGDDAYNYMVLLHNAATNYTALNDYQGALSSYKECARIAREHHFDRYLPRILSKTARIYLRLGDYVRAHVVLTEALNIALSLETQSDLLLITAMLGDLCVKIGDVLSGKRYLNEAGALLLQLGSSQSHIIVLEILIRHQLETCPSDRLIAMLESLRDESMPPGMTWPVNNAILLGIAYEKSENLAAASAEYEKARSLAQNFTHRCIHARVNYQLGLIKQKQGQAEQTLPLLQQALEHARRCPEWKIRQNIEKALADEYARTQDYRAALKHFKAMSNIENSNELANSMRLTERLHILNELEQTRAEISRVREEIEGQHTLREQLRAAVHRLATRDSQLMERWHDISTSLAATAPAGDAKVQQSIDDCVAAFEREIGLSHKQTSEDGFQARLRARCPSLTDVECRFCALVRINISGKELSRFLDISPRSVQVYRSRIRKKMGIAPDLDFPRFIQQI